MTIVLGFEDSIIPAQRLASALDAPAATIAVHRFPDHECLVRVPEADDTVILYRSLNDPDAKIIELIMAASAARDSGARRLILVVPYLAYMRQDKAFHRGEAVSQRVIGNLLSKHFDALLTIDPHLHRIASLSQVVPDIPAIALSAAPLLAGLLDIDENPLIVGPDVESDQWTRSIAEPLGLDRLCAKKMRNGDREVEVTIPDADRANGRVVVLVDDVAASCTTLVRAATKLIEAGAARVEAIVTHCLASSDDLARLAHAGVARFSSTDSIAGPTARVHVSTLLAAAVRNLENPGQPG